MLPDSSKLVSDKTRTVHNESSRVDLEILEKLCRYLDCEPSDLFVYTKEDD